MAAVALSEHVRESVEAEREVVRKRLAELEEQVTRVRAVLATLEGDAAGTSRLLRSIDEMLGVAPQMSMDFIHEELRGRKLQELATELLRQKRGPEAVVHYRDWFGLLTEEGVRVAGRDPLATFLTEIGRAPDVESVRPRSGLYRLRVA